MEFSIDEWFLEPHDGKWNTNHGIYESEWLTNWQHVVVELLVFGVLTVIWHDNKNILVKLIEQVTGDHKHIDN